MAQVATDYLIRFFGRFVLAAPKDPADRKKTLTLLAVDMTFNPALGFAKHCPTLSAPKALVIPGSTPSDLSLMANDYDTRQVEELSIWKLDRVQMDCDGVANDEIVWQDDELVPDLGSLSGGGLLNKANLAPQAAGGPTAFSFTIHGGSVRPLQLEQATYTFVQFGNSATTVSGTPQPIADGIAIAVTLKPGQPLTLKMQAAGGAASSIRLAARALAGVPPKIVTVVNLCGQPDAVVDTEFAAFYDVLQVPQAVGGRPVPKVTMTQGMEVACYPMSQVMF